MVLVGVNIEGLSTVNDLIGFRGRGKVFSIELLLELAPAVGKAGEEVVTGTRIEALVLLVDCCNFNGNSG